MQKAVCSRQVEKKRRRDIKKTLPPAKAGAK
jgi:hypothetical protein